MAWRAAAKMRHTQARSRLTLHNITGTPRETSLSSIWTEQPRKGYMHDANALNPCHYIELQILLPHCL